MSTAPEHFSSRERLSILNTAPSADTPEVRLLSFLRNVTGLHTSWGESTPVCKWRGVTCNDAQQVVSLCWIFELSGALLWNLLPVSLDTLQLQRNSFTGRVFLGDLPREMRKLDLSFNLFSGKLDWSVLPPSLRELNLSCNHFSGPIILQTLSHTAIEVILLQNNTFTSNLQLSDLPPKLRELNVEYNYLSGRPDFTRLHEGLRILHVGGNRLSSIMNLTVLPESLQSLRIQGSEIVPHPVGFFLHCGTYQRRHAPPKAPRIYPRKDSGIAT